MQETEIIGESEQENITQPSTEIVEGEQLEVSDGVQMHVEVESEKVDPFTQFFEEQQNTYQTEVVVDNTTLEEIASQQLELTKGIYINQLFVIGCVGAILVVTVLYSFLRKFY